MIRILSLWFGVAGSVGRAPYAASGFGLMAFKYGVEAFALWEIAGEFLTPWQFLNPLHGTAEALLFAAPAWTAWAFLAWSAPFLWIAISMSVRRAANAGASPWLGMVILVPVFNLALMLVLCVAPSAETDRWVAESHPSSDDALAKTGVLAVVASLVVGAAMVVVSVYLLGTYGSSLFVGAPLMMGAVAGYLVNRRVSRGFGASMSIGTTAVLFGGLALLLFALEGLICVVMAAPIMLPLGALGGVMGKCIAESTRPSTRGLAAAVLAAPVFAVGEAPILRSPEYVVSTSIEIDAAPQEVWEQVIEFPELAPPGELLFRAGIACPTRARIEGSGVGAVRYCEFTTGEFVEPITVWEQGRRLAFDVADQPAPMFELSPFHNVSPPHLHGYLRSNRGEFLLTSLPDGRTRLQGSTWYVFDMHPQLYWKPWSDYIIHTIHLRVLAHIRQVVEAEQDQ